MPIAFSHARHAPADVDVLGVPVAQGEPPGPGAELSDAFLAERGFEAKVGETLAIPDEQGGTVIAVGVGDPSAIDAAKREGLDVTVWDEKTIAKEKLGGLVSVAKGSDEPPRLIRLEYNPPGARATLAFVGKGITFDSGGLSIKTAEGMETMKTD